MIIITIEYSDSIFPCKVKQIDDYYPETTPDLLEIMCHGRIDVRDVICKILSSEETAERINRILELSKD